MAARGAPIQTQTAADEDRAGNYYHVTLLSRAARVCILQEQTGGLFHLREEHIMPGRGPQTFKKRQKEQQRREKQQEKMAKRLARKSGTASPGPSDQDDDTPFEQHDSEPDATEATANGQ